MNIDQFTERVIIVCTIFIWHLIVIHRFQSLANLVAKNDYKTLLHHDSR